MYLQQKKMDITIYIESFYYCFVDFCNMIYRSYIHHIYVQCKAV